MQGRASKKPEIGRRTAIGTGLATMASAFASACHDNSQSSTAGHAEPPVTRDAADLLFPSQRGPAAPRLRSRIADIGPLGEPDANGIRLPPGFSCRAIAHSGELVSNTSYRWHMFPDGGATFALEDGGWIYVSNSELPRIGGVGALRFSPAGAVVGAYPILDGTSMNCAGGPTPWGSWLSCEEIARGYVFECDPHGQLTAQQRPALGVFRHEAVAIDTEHHHLYLTEDEPDGRLYRFTPQRVLNDGRFDLRAGTLHVATVGSASTDGTHPVEWLPVLDPLFHGDTPTRYQVQQSSVFRGGEGIWWQAGMLWFSTKYDDRIWRYDTNSENLSLIYDGANHNPRPIQGVDNLTVSCCGDVLVAEDAGHMQIVAIVPDGRLIPLVQLVGQDRSEITGPAFDPSGTRLYFSSQRGDMRGITYELSGPFHQPT